VYLERLDNTFAAGARISIGKARTAALFKKPTAAFERNGHYPFVEEPGAFRDAVRDWLSARRDALAPHAGQACSSSTIPPST